MGYGIKISFPRPPQWRHRSPRREKGASVIHKFKNLTPASRHAEVGWLYGQWETPDRAESRHRLFPILWAHRSLNVSKSLRNKIWKRFARSVVTKLFGRREIWAFECWLNFEISILFRIQYPIVSFWGWSTNILSQASGFLWSPPSTNWSGSIRRIFCRSGFSSEYRTSSQLLISCSSSWMEIHLYQPSFHRF